MFTITLDPIIFSIGHLHIRWYSLIVLTAIIVGIWLVAKEASRKGFKKDAIYDIAVWIVLGGLIGARLFHVIDHWSDTFAADPIRVLNIWEGGLAIWGGITGGLIVGAILARRRGWRFPRLLDAAAPGLVLAQAIGRVACVITGDAMGKPTNGPFGFAYTSPNAMVPQLGVYYTPMPVYEIIANLGIFALLWSLRKKNWPDGLLFLIYLTLYSVERFFLAFTSSYQIMVYGLTQSQVVAMISFVIAIPLIVRTLKRHQQMVSAG
ncbi:MAG: prolipoprotein diacylglyceryl transferase [Chloroflexi bacterium GWB2_49_20]|nr:MAG: prolipoprotein diacylglyceryl transferase [Chloroflexi bacterium GWB2_49_20]OGN77737.1 MAG: prolipoprotein diacylglyceryl transferase [Chloroflexi bacterium GWC2_49_37]OGN86512.1 MAG: prolipoprotein diacylglyceryl transferase [Chloroflexi bacterium GWD2_49_16]HBG74764.1 prolipoprotein diacylglyceryl transferase [Anaerolineae bacterium]